MEFSKILKAIESEPGYRVDQITRAIFVDLVEDWNEVTGLPKKLRKELQQEFPLEIKV